MSPSLSWFDRDELRGLLEDAGVEVGSVEGVLMVEEVGAPRRSPSTLSGQFGHNNRFAAIQGAAPGRFAGPVVTKSGPPAAPAFDPKATRLAAGVERPSASGGQPASFAPNEGASFAKQLEALMAWSLQTSGAQRAFVADREGLLLASRGDPDSAESLAGSVCPALEHALRGMEGAEQAMARGHVHLDRGDGPLALVWANAWSGRLFLGMVGGPPAPAATLAHIADALGRVSTS